jgi:hypothetical protein
MSVSDWSKNSFLKSRSYPEPGYIRRNENDEVLLVTGRILLRHERNNLVAEISGPDELDEPSTAPH